MLRWLVWLLQANYPKRFNYLPGVLLGQFDMQQQGPLALIRAGYDRCGEIFRLRVLHQNITFCVGPRAQAFFFGATDQQLSQKEVRSHSYCSCDVRMDQRQPARTESRKPRKMQRLASRMWNGSPTHRPRAHCALCLLLRVCFFRCTRSLFPCSARTLCTMLPPR